MPWRYGKSLSAGNILYCLNPNNEGYVIGKQGFHFIILVEGLWAQWRSKV
jgi:hypothetical protein